MRGFGLIEGLFAAVVLAIGSLGVASALAHGASVADSSRDELQAWDVVRHVRGRMQAADWSQVALTFHRKGFAVEGLDAVDGDADGMPGSIVCEPVDGHLNTYKVTVQVDWQRSGLEKSVSTEFYLTNLYNDANPVTPLEQVKPGTVSLDPVRTAPTTEEPVVLQDPIVIEDPLAGAIK